MDFGKELTDSDIVGFVCGFVGSTIIAYLALTVVGLLTRRGTKQHNSKRLWLFRSIVVVAYFVYLATMSFYLVFRQ